MSYLDEYDSRRPLFDRLVRAIGLLMLAGIALYCIYWLFFRNWREESQVREFLQLVQQQQYEEAYQAWGCTPEDPCRFYPYESFLEDWGPESPLGEISSYELGRSYTQEGGVIIELTVDGEKQPNLWVESDSNKISFFPY